MKIYLLLCVFIIASLSAFSQIVHIEVLLGKSELYVTNYLDSLNRLKSNPNYKIKKSVSDEGSLILENAFILEDEAYYSCYSVLTRFLRIKGTEICVKEVIVGTKAYAQKNLVYIKDNFNFVSNSKWEQPFVELPNLKITATFESLKNEASESYAISYTLSKN
jgi:hypothetical protein